MKIKTTHMKLCLKTVLLVQNFLRKFGLCFLLYFILFHENCEYYSWISTYIFWFNTNRDFSWEKKLNIICWFILKILHFIYVGLYNKEIYKA